MNEFTINELEKMAGMLHSFCSKLIGVKAASELENKPISRLTLINALFFTKQAVDNLEILIDEEN